MPKTLKHWLILDTVEVVQPHHALESKVRQGMESKYLKFWVFWPKKYQSFAESERNFNQDYNFLKFIIALRCDHTDYPS